MSRAVSALHMWSRMAPPCRAHAPANSSSDARWTSSSSGRSGYGNGGRIAIAWSRVSKHRSGVLRLVPRGSNPTMSKLARNSSGRLLATAQVFDQLGRSEEHTSELQSRQYLVCRLLLEKKK